MRLAERLTLLLLGGIWGSSFLFMRVAEPELGAVPLIALRVSLAALVLVAWLAARGELGRLRGHARAFFVLGALNSAVPFTLYAWSTRSLGAGLPSVLNATVPMFGAMVAFLWLRERLGLVRGLGLALGFAGVLVLTWPKLVAGAADSSALGVAAGLLAAILYALAAHYSKRHLSGVAPLVVAAGSLLGASALLVPPALLLLPAQTPSARALGAALALAVLCTSVAQALFFRLLQTLGPTRAITVTYLIPAFGLLWSFLFLGEPLTPRMLLGSAIVVVGTAIVLRAAAPPTPRPGNATLPATRAAS